MKQLTLYQKDQLMTSLSNLYKKYNLVGGRDGILNVDIEIAKNVALGNKDFDIPLDKDQTNGRFSIDIKLKYENNKFP